MLDETVLINRHCEGALIESNLNLRATDSTAKIIYKAGENPPKHLTGNILYGNGAFQNFEGSFWNDTICLAQSTPPEGMVGRKMELCVKEQEFLAIDDIWPPKSFSEMGIVGLAPGKSQKSVLNTLKKQNIIDHEVMAIDLEEESISFGEIKLPLVDV